VRLNREILMKRFLAGLFASVVCLLAVGAQSASAQAPYPYNRPSPYGGPLLSPYLNLLRGGDQASNYYLGVIPERDRRRNDVLFRSSILDLEERTNVATTSEEADLLRPLRSTGHVTAFGNTSTYFGQTSLQLPGARPAVPQQQSGSRPRR
jgi:hypothetical protein